MKLFAMNKYHLVLCAQVLLLGGCSSSDSVSGGSDSPSMKDASISGWGGNGGSYGAGGMNINIGGSAGSSGSGTVPALPPEQEQKLDFLAPQAGAHFVYVANPSRNTVSVIDSTTLAISELAPRGLADLRGHRAWPRHRPGDQRRVAHPAHSDRHDDE
jgi:DNA-binding beta-propeller fold protein YncE